MVTYKAIAFSLLFFFLDTVLSFFFTVPFGLFVKQFGVVESFGIGADLLLWRVIYMQAGVQILLLFLIYRAGYQKSILACLSAVVVSFVVSASLFTSSFLGALRLLLPEFSEGIFNEGFVVLSTAALAWLALYVLVFRREPETNS